MLRLFNPGIYQGNKKLKKYFEGWYFKIVSGDESRVFSFIPGVSLNPGDPHSFIQYLDGISGKSHYVRYRVKDFWYSGNSFEVKIGSSYFSEDKLELDIKEPGFRVQGEVDFKNRTRFPSNLFSPGIMGWYSFVPFMECKHGVISMNHTAHGRLKINNHVNYFRGGKSYIEKDWGVSFPAAWIWTQCNNFDDPGVSVMLSVAKIPWLGSYFMGFISFALLNGKTYLFATYNGSKLTLSNFNEKFIYMDLLHKDYALAIRIERRKSGELKAPERGVMSRMIKESVDSVVEISLKGKDGKELFTGTGRRAGLEVTSNIFELLEEKTING